MAQDPERRRRKFQWRYVFAGLLIAVFALYSGVWYHLSGRLATQAAAAIARENGNGKRAACENLATGGFPLGIGLYCSSILFENDTAGFSIVAGRLQSAIHIYAPLTVTTEIASPAHLEYPGLLPIDLTWNSFAANVRFGQPLPSNISFSATNLRLSASRPDGSQTGKLLSLASGEISLAPQGRDLDFTAALRKLSTRIADRDATLDGKADIRIADGVRKMTAGNGKLRDTSAQIRNLSVSTSGGGTIALSGPLSVDKSGFVNGQISVEITQAKVLAADLSKIMPRAAEQIGTMIGLVAPPQNGNKGRIEVRIMKGKIYAGLFLIGEVPRVSR